MVDLIVLLVIFLLIYLVCKGAPDSPAQRTKTDIVLFYCPTCGAPAMIRGKQWECGECGDFGNLEWKYK